MTIAFFGTGGTISNRGTESDNYLDYLDYGTVMEAHELLERYPTLDDIAEIRVEPFGALRSKYITAAHWSDLAQRITRVLAEPEITGAVISHGTGTLEETAWFLHLVVNATKPLVVVGAQRPGSTVASDTQLNLSDAFRVATHPASHNVGVTVVMNRQIHSARDVSKVANYRLDAMQSPVRGPLGVIAADHSVQYWRTPQNPHTCQSRFAGLTTPLPRVDIIHAYTDADETAVDAFLSAGARGLVAVGYPPGTLTKPLDEALDQAIAQNIQVVQASRADLEPAVAPRPGLTQRGLIPNTDITPAKAKVLLQLCLAQELAPEATAEVFATY